jgi:hypothetical protein
MTWIFSKALMEAYGNSPSSPGLVEEYSPVISLGGEPFAQLNVMPTPHKFWHNGKTMDASGLSRFGLTCAVLTEHRGEELLMSFREDFHVKTLAAQGKDMESEDLGPVYGPIWLGLFPKFDLLDASSKTVRCLPEGGSTGSYPILPRWGSMRNGEFLARPTLERLTKGKESGSSLPTPSGCRSGKNHVGGRLDEWGGSSNPWRGTETGRTSSPAFEEWVMGWPVQWTELTACVTVRFQRWQQQHSASFQE